MKRSSLVRLALAGAGLASALGAVVLLALPDDEVAPGRVCPVLASRRCPAAPDASVAKEDENGSLPVYGVPRPAFRQPKPGSVGSLLVTLGRARGANERVQIVAETLARSKPEEALAIEESLLRSELPGTPDEREVLRLFLIARLGEAPGPRAEEILVARLDGCVPRPERLMAIEALAARPDSARGGIEAIARGDHDGVVQDKARWALARAR